MFRLLFRFFLAAAMLFVARIAIGQGNVGINNPAPHASALLDLTSTNKGLLTPRMTTAQRTAIAAPATGLLVFDTSLNAFWYYDGTAWAPVATGGTGWSTTGNAGTSIATHFIGTTDNVPLSFRVNNVAAGRIDPINENVSLGRRASASLTTGTMNTCVGDSAGGALTFGYENTLVGANTGRTMWGSPFNTFIGSNAGASLLAGAGNTYVGAWAGRTGGGLGTGGNTFVGASAGYAGATAGSSTFLGAYAGAATTTGAQNTFVGWCSGQNNILGADNTFLGRSSGSLNTTGSNNTYIGSQAGGTAALTRAVAIGYNAQVTQSNSLVLGGTGADALSVGIGTTAPTAELEVNGFTKLGSDAPAVRVLKFTSTTAAIQGNAISIPHGLTASKILAIDVLVEASAGFWVPANYTGSPGFHFQWNLQSLVILVANVTGASANILSKPVKILVTYEE